MGSIMRFVSLIFLFLSLNALAQIRPFQTTRLLSTGGTGVASLLVSEAAVLNPAPLAFFSDTFASYQNTRAKLSSEADERKTDSRNFADSSRHEGYFLFDNSTAIKGGFSYQYQNENGFRRRRGTMTLATPVNSNVSVGLLYRYTEDTRPDWYSSERHRTSHPVTLGVSWIKSTNLTLGAVWDDPTRASTDESRALVGAQYNLTSDFMLMADVGGDPTGDFLGDQVLRGSLQYNAFADFYLRAGKFRDELQNLAGESWGVSWTGPKLGVDFAMRNSRQIQDETAYLYEDEKITDLSFAIGLRY